MDLRPLRALVGEQLPLLLAAAPQTLGLPGRAVGEEILLPAGSRRGLASLRLLCFAAGRQRGGEGRESGRQPPAAAQHRDPGPRPPSNEPVSLQSSRTRAAPPDTRTVDSCGASPSPVPRVALSPPRPPHRRFPPVPPRSHIAQAPPVLPRPPVARMPLVPHSTSSAPSPRGPPAPPRFSPARHT